MEHPLNGPALWAESEHHQAAYGVPSRCSLTAPRPSSCRRTRVFVEKVIVTLWVSTLDPTGQDALVMCVDEKTQIQALDRNAAAVAHAPR